MSHIARAFGDVFLFNEKERVLASRVLSEDVIQQSVSSELSNVVRGVVLVQGLQLRLALVELFMVSLKNNNWVALKQVILSNQPKADAILLLKH